MQNDNNILADEALARRLAAEDERPAAVDRMDDTPFRVSVRACGNLRKLTSNGTERRQSQRVRWTLTEERERQGRAPS